MRNPLLYCFIAILSISCGGKAQEKTVKTFPVEKTDQEWRQTLTQEQYYVLRQEGTERPHSSILNKNYEEGEYHCAACDALLFRSEHKFDSGSGWPSFDREVPDAVGFSTDYKLGYGRSEEHCANCGGHLGHVFSDGPRETTGKRHCINGDALTFVPKKG